MKIKMLLIVFSLVMLPIHVGAAEKLTGDQIKAVFEGNTYDWQHTKRSDSGKSYLDPSGSRMLTKNGKKVEGSWSIEGNQLCFKGKKKLCRDVEKDGDMYYLIKDRSKRVVKITKVEEGNTI